MRVKSNEKWSYVTLSELGFIGRGKSKHRPRNDGALYGGNYPFIQTSDIKHANFYVTSYSQTYNEIGLRQSKLWQKDTLCMTIAANIAETALLSFPACFPDSIVGFVANPIKSDVRFIKYALDHAKKNFQKTAKGTAQDNLSLEKIDNLKLKIPSVSYQAQVASIVSEYDELIEINENRIKLLEEMAQSLYNEWFVKFRFPGHGRVMAIDSGTEFGMIPEGWEIKRVKDIGKVITGKTPPTNNSEYYGSDIPFIKTPDMHENVFLIGTSQRLSKIGADYQVEKYIPAKSVVVSCIGTIGVVGITSTISQTNQQINSIVLNDHSDYCMLYFFVKGLKDRLVSLGSNGATMGNVNKGKFENIVINYPNNNVRKLYFKQASMIFNNILSLQNRIINLVKIRDSLINQLISGNRELKKL